MSLFPFMINDIADVNQTVTTYKEYEFNFKTGKLTGKILEGKAALKMWIYKALLTKRYIYPIYSWDYGQDIEELIGKGYEKGFIESEVERRAQECLMINERIIRCHSFEISLINDQLNVNFTVDTTFGEVAVNV